MQTVTNETVDGFGDKITASIKLLFQSFSSVIKNECSICEAIKMLTHSLFDQKSIEQLELNNQLQQNPFMDYSEIDHLGLAEKGKLFVIHQDFEQAILLFNQAISLAEEHEENVLFGHHYQHCIMEAMELAGDHHGLIDYCTEYLELLNGKTDYTSRRNAIFIKERIGVQFLILNKRLIATSFLKQVVNSSFKDDFPLAEVLLNKIYSREPLDKDRIKWVQNDCNYFIIQPTSVLPFVDMNLLEVDL